MTIKQIAADFNMTVKEFAEYLGYSRVAMYCTNAAVSHKKTRVKAAVRLLCSLNQKQFDEEMQKAGERFNERKEAIAAFEKMLLGHDAGEIVKTVNAPEEAAQKNVSLNGLVERRTNGNLN